ncbi:outer membrane protein assembly factor BamC [Glaciecola sp. KUL10]|uniref:outer membrane protein assembly factor BamC n=1 Tax=Glaciecola sp. (strain KUL10) TaxID=2161813 RepID=UPI000D78831B|nr:outer membrane protein assembly factor BamC [Glaciecola sp. KUL10]GBL02994.1 Outer membrane protein assembly factor BamC [Glaciecola sp. KUL10]
MKNKVVALSVTCIALAGCASKEERELASGSFQYLEASQYNVIEIPEDLENPNFSNRYALPSLNTESENTLYGQKLKVTSPRLVLPLVSGSHVEEGSEDAKVLFDQVNDDEPLQQTIWNTVLAFLEKQNIGVDNFDKENNILVTDWVISTEEVDGGWLDFSSVEQKDVRKYQFNLNVAPHGRSAALSTQLVELLDNNGNSVLANADELSLRNDSTSFLNQVIAEYDFGIRLEQSKRIAKIRRGFNTNLGFDSDGEPALVVEAIYANTWPRLLLVLKKMGFDVKDLDQSSGLLFVQFNGTDDSWFDSIFNSTQDLGLDKDEYRLKVESLGAQTAVTFLDNESNALSVDTVTQIYSLFSEYMATEDLDI